MTPRAGVIVSAALIAAGLGVRWDWHSATTTCGSLLGRLAQGLDAQTAKHCQHIALYMDGGAILIIVGVLVFLVTIVRWLPSATSSRRPPPPSSWPPPSGR